MSRTQTKPKTVHQTTQTATVFQTIKNSGAIYFVLAFFGPFLHLFAKTGQEGILHWPWMSSFLDSLGWALLPLFMGLGLMSFSRRLQEENKKVLRSISLVAVAIGAFYLAYTLISIRDFSNFQYYSMLTAIGLASTVLLIQIHKAFKTTEQKLLKVIASLSRFIVFKGKELAAPENKEEYIKEYREALIDGMKKDEQ